MTIQELIVGIPAFDGLAPEHLAAIADCGRPDGMEAGELLFRAGDDADVCYVLRSGALALEIEPPGGAPLVIETLHAGDVVGWSWLWPPYRWAFDGRVMDDVELIRFDARCLRGKADTNAELGYALMQRFSKIMLTRLQAARVRLIDVYGTVPR